MKEELRAKQLEILLDLNRGELCVSEANTKMRELHTRPEQVKDVCPVDDVREAFDYWEEESDREPHETTSEVSAASEQLSRICDALENDLRTAFIAGAESKQAEIDRLKAENEAMRCCGNCEYDGQIFYNRCHGCKHIDKRSTINNWQPKENN